MLRFRPFLVSLSVFCAGALAETRGSSSLLEWRWSNPSPTGNSLIMVNFPDSIHGVAVSELGEVAETRDGGWTWSLRPGRVSSGKLVSADMRPDGSILACDSDGRLWKSSDGGATWRNSATFSNILFDIRSCGSEVALAVGLEGIILRSVDGGGSWSQVRRDSLGPGLLSVHCGKDLPAHAVGSQGILLRSLDLGKTWHSLASPSPDLLSRVTFADSLRGLVATGEGRVLSTRDGGRSWKSTLLDSLAFFRSLGWKGSDVTLAGSYGGLWKSRDDGANWVRVESRTSLFLEASAHVGATGEVVVGDYGVILHSRDGGTHWESRRMELSNDVFGLTLITREKWLAFGSEGLLLKSEDAGLTWKAKGSGTANHLAGAFNGKRGAVSGYNGSLIYTGDEGETWRQAQTPAFKGRLFGVSFADSLTATAVGDSGTVWRSMDGGVIWTAQSGIPDLGLQTLSATSFLPGGSGIIVGYDGLIFATKDRGSSWTKISAPVSTDLYGMSFRDSQVGVAVGEKGMVLVSRDGGLSWNSRPTGDPGDNLYDAAWLGGDTILVHGERSHRQIIRLSTDGGGQWTEIVSPSRPLLWAMQGLGSGRAAFLGQKGTVLIAELVHDRTPIHPHSPLLYPGFAVSRTGNSWRANFTLPQLAGIRIAIHSLDGKRLGQLYRGEKPAGRHSLVFPDGQRQGPLVFLLEGGSDKSSFRRTAILPY